MSMIQLDKHGSWTLGTTPDHDGELELEYGDGYESGGTLYLDTAQLKTLGELFESIASLCTCNYIAERRIMDEFTNYHRTNADEYCPFHGEKEK